MFNIKTFIKKKNLLKNRLFKKKEFIKKEKKMIFFLFSFVCLTYTGNKQLILKNERRIQQSNEITCKEC
jgi:hypothetical protein